MNGVTSWEEGVYCCTVRVVSKLLCSISVVLCTPLYCSTVTITALMEGYLAFYCTKFSSPETMLHSNRDHIFLTVPFCCKEEKHLQQQKVLPVDPREQADLIT